MPLSSEKKKKLRDMRLGLTPENERLVFALSDFIDQLADFSDKLDKISSSFEIFGQRHEEMSREMANMHGTMKATHDPMHPIKMIDRLDGVLKALVQLGEKQTPIVVDTSEIAQNIGSLKDHFSKIMKESVGAISISASSSGNFIPYASDIKTLANATVASSGTAVKLSSSAVMCRQVTITALSTNTGTIFYGDANVSASGNKDTPLNPFAVATININDVSKIYIDSTVSGDAVSVSYLA